MNALDVATKEAIGEVFAELDVQKAGGQGRHITWSG